MNIVQFESLEVACLDQFYYDVDVIGFHYFSCTAAEDRPTMKVLAIIESGVITGPRFPRCTFSYEIST